MAGHLKQVWRVCISLGLILLGRAYAQTSPDVAPPPISFPNWRQVDEAESGTEFDLEFPSAYVSGVPANDRVPLKVLIPAEGNAPYAVVVILHYWGATDLRAEFSLASDLNSIGIAAAIMTLPYHLDRTPPGHRSGELAVTSDPDKLLATTTQAALDVRRTVDFIETRPEFRHDRIGIVGTSLGALVAALAYGVEPRIRYAAFVLGGADLAHIVWSSSRVVLQRDALRRQGITEERLRELLKPVEPLTYLPRRNPGPTFVIGARFDTVIPPASTEALIGGLPGASVLEIDTGHYGGIFVERKVLREVSAFFGDVTADRPFHALKSLYAPTIRIGGIAATDHGVDVGAGVDIFRFDRRGDAFADLFLTPRGLRLMAMRRIASGFSVGLDFSTRTAGVGVLWSSVL